MRSLLFLIIVLCACGPTFAQEADIPDFTYEEVEPYKISGAEYIRVDSEVAGIAPNISILIDREGNVENAIILKGQSRQADLIFPKAPLKKALLEAVKEWKFRPYISEGKAIRYKTEIHIPVYPMEQRLENPPPFPEIRDDNFKITLVRDYIGWNSKSHEVTIYGDGKVEYQGYDGAVIIEPQTYSISSEQVHKLVNAFDKSDFFSLKDKYSSPHSNIILTTLSIKIGQHKKAVVDIEGVYVGMPRAVRELQNLVDDIAQTERFVKGNDETIPFLEAQGFDFQSKSAQEILLRASSRSPESLLIALLDKDIPTQIGSEELRRCPKCKMIENIHAYLLEKSAKNDYTELFNRINTDEFFNFIDQEALDEALYTASYSHSTHIVKKLIDRGANISGDKYSALIATVEYLRFPKKESDVIEIVNILLNNKVDLERVDHFGNTALQNADELPEVMRVLIDAGANVNAGSNNKRDDGSDDSTLSFTKNQKVAVMLLKAGAAIPLRSGGISLKHYAQEQGWSDVLRLLDERETQ